MNKMYSKYDYKKKYQNLRFRKRAKIITTARPTSTDLVDSIKMLLGIGYSNQTSNSK